MASRRAFPWRCAAPRCHSGCCRALRTRAGCRRPGLKCSALVAGVIVAHHHKSLEPRGAGEGVQTHAGVRYSRVRSQLVSNPCGGHVVPTHLHALVRSAQQLKVRGVGPVQFILHSQRAGLSVRQPSLKLPGRRAGALRGQLVVACGCVAPRNARGFRGAVDLQQSMQRGGSTSARACQRSLHVRREWRRR